MCRITGGMHFSSKEFSSSALHEMRDAMIAGGPDHGGSWWQGQIGIAHRRLSIIDLSEAGNQPMVSGDWVMAFNGEVYNYVEIRDELIASGYTFTTGSDTEVVIKAINCWGKSAVHKFRGMFAFALWNVVTKKLLLCRDRFGVKPLYYYQKDDLFLFASEIKAFHKHPEFDKTIHTPSIAHFLKKGYMDVKESIYKYVSKQPPGSFIEISEKGEITIEKYWDIETVFQSSVPANKGMEEWITELEKNLTESFKLRMVADVEVGVFLSGGIDSTLVTALLQKDNVKPLQTFTIGFEDPKYNEAEIASEIARILGTQHTTMTCSEEAFRAVIPTFPDMYDEPFGDSSAIPTFLVSRLARKNVKVALSGDGGDELFGGYSKYIFARKAQFILSIPLLIRRLIYRFSMMVKPHWIDRLARISGYKKYSQIGNKFLKFRQTLIARDIDDFFDKSSSYINERELAKLTGQSSTLQRESGKPKSMLITYFGKLDIQNYLPGDILTKVDRASMHCALEAREPFLDPELVKFAFSIPDELKISSKGENKFLLRKILAKYIPEELINRPKQGFTVPMDSWLNGFLREDVLQMQNDAAFFKVMALDAAYAREMISSYFNHEQRYNPHIIWFMLCLYKWYIRWK